MTPEERVQAVLFRRGADQVPFTVYQGMVSQCRAERRLRNEGLCIVRLTRVYETGTPDVTEKVCRYRENGRLKERKDYSTPHGDLFTVSKIVDMDAPNQTTSWYEQKLFKGPEDYGAIRFMIENRVHSPDYERFMRAQASMEGDVLLRSEIAYEPMQEILISIMDLRNFAFEWKKNRDEVLSLYQALVKDRNKIYPIVARSPAQFSNYGGNVAPEILGAERFEKYVLPDYARMWKAGWLSSGWGQQIDRLPHSGIRPGLYRSLHTLSGHQNVGQGCSRGLARQDPVDEFPFIGPSPEP